MDPEDELLSHVFRRTLLDIPRKRKQSAPVNSSFLRSILLLRSLWCLTGCTTVRDLALSNIPTLQEGKASIVVNLRSQRATLYRGGVEVADADISTGREGYETPAGHYRVIRKDHNHRSSLYGDYVDDDGNVLKANVDVRKNAKPAHSHYVGASMPYFLEFKPGYGLHAGHLPGRPASHGCVRLSYWRARQFYHAAEIGTPVIVKR
jgi:lipoprotein-anchoring transpeptidase ErfK/SrfK